MFTSPSPNDPEDGTMLPDHNASEFALEQLFGPTDPNPATPIIADPETFHDTLQELIPELPIPPIPLVKNRVSGSYRSAASSGYELELRVDVDGVGPTQRVSGDYYSISGATKTYFGSFIVNVVSVTLTTTQATLTGTAECTWTTDFRRLQITIQRTTIFQSPAPAQLRWFSVTNNTPGAAYQCNYVSRYFRTVVLEQDSLVGVTPFGSYNTGGLPSGGAARTLGVIPSYREAGIDIQIGGTANVIANSGAGANGTWSDAELHNAMQANFALWQNIPQWKVWLFHSYQHDLGLGLYGIMFDQQGRQRQGCATFYRGIGGTTNDQLRLQLYTNVHELGHCFNLMHSWQKSYAQPSLPNRPSALSWMNYPWNFPGGPAAFWNSFDFRFDSQELIHLRHAFRDKVIMGGNPFTEGAALDSGDLFADTIENNTGLQIELEAKPSFALGEPVVVEIRLRTTSTLGKSANTCIHPKFGYVHIGIVKPGGKVVTYEPLAEYLMEPDIKLLTEESPSAYDSAYIGYGKDGFYFDQPGTYQIRASYFHLDGSRIVSDIIKIRVKSPLSADDDSVADLLLGDDQGQLFYLLGSDSPYLKAGNEAFDQIIDQFPTHPLTMYAKLAKGVNDQRTFKSITEDKELTVRSARPTESAALLTDVVDQSKASVGSKADVGLDNISLNMAMRKLAKAQSMEGNDEAAKETLTDMVNFLGKQTSRPHVRKLIREQAKNALKEP
jgi:hypothetical protein